MLAVAGGWILIFCLLPLGRLLAELVVLGAADGWALAESTLSARFARKALVNTLEAGLAGTVLSVLLGGGVALLVGLTDVRRKTLLAFLMLMPLLIPAQISALAWLELIGPGSFLYALPGLAYPAGARNPLYSGGGVMLLMGVEHAPMVFLAVRAGLRGLPGDLIEAARAAGAGPLRLTFGVILPLLRPAILAGAALAFVSAIGNFGVPALLGIPGRYPMMTTYIYQRLNGFGPGVLGEVAVLSLVLALLAAAGLALQAWVLRRNRVSVDRGGRALAPFALGRARPAVEAAVWLLMTAIALLPLAALVGTSLSQALGVPLSLETVTLAHFAYVFDNPATMRAFANSTLLAALAGGFCVAISAPLAYLVVVRRHPLARILSLGADAPYVLPGIVLAIACILLYLKPLPGLGGSLYNTLGIILVAYLGRFVALALRPAMAGMAQIDPGLEDAARIAGAGTLRRFTSIVLPLAAPAAVAGGVLVFMAAFNELTVSALLWSAGNETLGVSIFALYDEGNSNAAAALSLLTVIATLAVAGLATLAAHLFRLPDGVLPWRD